MKTDLKLFWKYIAPSMTAMLIAGSFSIVDTIFVGRGVGETGLAGIALTWPLVMFVYAFGDLFGSGAAVMIAQAHGAGDERSAFIAFGNMATMLALSGVLLSALFLTTLEPILKLFGATPELLPYALDYAEIAIGGSIVFMLMTGAIDVIRNDGRPQLAMWITVAGLLCNIVLDWLFIMEFRWGAAGAAWATVWSQGVSLAIGVWYFCSSKSTLKIGGKNLRPYAKIAKRIFFTGIPIFGNIVSIIAMLFLHNFQALRYGGIDALAAYTLVAGLESLGSMLMTGLACGVQPLAASFYGSGENSRQNRIGNYGYISAFAIGLGLMLMCFALRHQMPEWVGLSGEVASLAAHGVLISSTAFLLLGVIRVAAFYYQSTGKIRESSLVIYGDAFFALPLCLFVLPTIFGMDGVWLAMPVSRLLLFALVLYLWFGKCRGKKLKVCAY